MKYYVKLCSLINICLNVDNNKLISRESRLDAAFLVLNKQKENKILNKI